MNEGTIFGANVGVALARLMERGLVVYSQGKAISFSLRTRV
jgi:hypothetical protein